MKNLRIIPSIAVLTLLACACLPDVEFPLQPQENLLTATIGSDPATKTSLSTEEDNYSKVLWTKGDQIGVFVNGEPNLYAYTLVSGAGKSEAVFSGFGTGASYIAVYPYTVITGLSGETVSVDLPLEQAFTNGSFGNGSNPMVAVSNNTALPFRNLCAVLKVSMTGHHNVTSLVFRPNDKNVKVAGPATISLADPDHPLLTVSEGGCDSLVLNTGVVMLDDETPTDFYLVLPAQTYKGGFTVRVNTVTGYMDKRLDTDITLERARKYDARPFAVKLDVGVDPSSVLEGGGTEKQPFLIRSLGDLLLMQGAVNAAGKVKSANGGVVEANAAYYLLTDDIDLSPVCGAASGKSWTPIGNLYDTDENKFFGYFDGGGHRISNLYIKWKTPGSGVIPTTYVGLFGQSKEGEIKNLTVDGEINAEYSYAGLISGIRMRLSVRRIERRRHRRNDLSQHGSHHFPLYQQGSHFYALFGSRRYYGPVLGGLYHRLYQRRRRFRRYRLGRKRRRHHRLSQCRRRVQLYQQRKGIGRLVHWRPCRTGFAGFPNLQLSECG